MNCEICKKECLFGKTWGIQIMGGLKSEFHYYCSKEHAKLGEESFGQYKKVGEAVDVK